MADPHRNVDPFFQQISHPVDQAQVHCHLGVASHEPVEYRGHVMTTEQHRGRNRQGTAGFTLLVAKHILDIADFPNHRATDVGVQLALLRDPHVSGGALEQAHTQVLLRGGQYPDHRRQRDIELFRGGREAAVLDYRQHHPHRLNRVHQPPRLSLRITE